MQIYATRLRGTIHQSGRAYVAHPLFTFLIELIYELRLSDWIRGMIYGFIHTLFLIVFLLFNLINLFFFSDYFSHSFLQWFIHAEMNYIVYYAWRKKIIIR